MRSVPSHSIPIAIALSAIMSAVLVMTGCSDVPKHPGQWEEGTSPLGEKAGTTKKKTDDDVSKSQSDDNKKPKGMDTTTDDTKKTPDATDTTAEGIWVRTEVTTTLTDSDGEEMISYYENVLDDHGNVDVTAIESDDWEGRISYDYDEDGYRTFCEFDGDDDFWIPEFECGFLGMVLEERTPCTNTLGQDGLLARSVMGEDGDMTATYEYDSDGRLARLSTSDGRTEEYDENGNILRIAETDPDDPSYTETVTYDYRYTPSGTPKSAKLTHIESDGEDTEREPFGNIAYETDDNGNITRATVTDVEDEFGYVLVVECEYEYVPNPSRGSRLYAQMDRFGTFF